MKKIIPILLGLVALTIVIVGCGNEEEAKSMEQIYSEEGVPVRTESLTLSEFSTLREYNAVLTGIRESSAYAMISDKIDKIHFKVGDYVEKDQIVLSFPTDNPSAQYYQAKVTFENAKVTFNRMENYYKTGGLSKQSYDDARAGYEVAEANWNAVKQAVKVKAPISGVVTRLNVQETDNVEKDDELFVISQVDRLKAKLWVPEKEIAEYKKGQKVTAEWGGKTIEGEIAQVDMSMNVQKQAFGVVVEFENPGILMNFGVTANVKVETYSNPGVIVVERKNIHKVGDKSYVFVLNSEHAKKRAVVLGRGSDLDVEIIEGLNPGEKLITEGQLLLEDGTKVRVVGEPEANLVQNDQDGV